MKQQTNQESKRDGNLTSWLLQCPPGLADALKREMVFAGAIERKQTLFIKRQRNHDLLFTSKLKNEEGIEKLRIAEQILRCPVYGRFKISKRQLEDMSKALKELGPRRLVVQVAGRHFDRRDLSRWLTKEMEARGVSFSLEEEDDEVWMFCIDEAYYFGVPLRKSYDAEGRDERKAEREGSLPPPIAAALAFAGQPRADDVILDPVCGSGTLLAEAQAYAPQANFLGFDIDPKAVEIARSNLGKSVTLNVGDSRKAQWPKADISLVLANLPFGVQFGSKADNPALYRDILANILRVARPTSWRAVLLTSDMESLRQALSELMKDGHALETHDLFRVKIRGELATAILVKLKSTSAK